MARKKKDAAEKLEKKNLELKPFTIQAYLHEGPESKIAIVKIAECKYFKIQLTSWDSDPIYWSRIHVSNKVLTSYNGKHLIDRVGDVIEFEPNMSIPAECWGEDVPDDVRKFLKERISEFIVELPKQNDEGWTLSLDKKYGFPVAKFNELMNNINGICMARKKKSRRTVSKKEKSSKE